MRAFDKRDSARAPAEDRTFMRRGKSGEHLRAVRRIPGGIAVSELEHAGKRLFIVSYPKSSMDQRDPRDEPWCRLTPAEHAVVVLLLEGRTPAQVARERGTSVRTVTKQIDSAYRRLGAHSRNELALLLPPNVSALNFPGS
jgi:DNA-binding CsgD family transcriptional regulator